MLKNYLKTTARNLLKHKTFSLINILGFAFSLAICLIISLFIIKESTTDRFYSNSENIYKLIDRENNSSEIDYRVVKTIQNNIPGIKNSCFFRLGDFQVEINHNQNKCTINNFMSADNDYFKVFSIPFLYGDKKNPFPNINSAVITKSTAEKLFGKVNPLGKELFEENDSRVIISGVIPDFPENASARADIIVSAANKYYNSGYFCSNSEDSSSYRYYYNAYFQLNANTSAKEVINKINKNAGIMYPYLKNADLIPLKNIYLYDNTLGNSSRKGNPALLKILLSIAVIILILAIINYINLSVAQQNRRNKETGIRKTVGAARKDIIINLLTESVLVTFAAFIVSVLISELTIPYFSEILNSKLSLLPLATFPGNLIIISFVLITGLIAGIGPAILISSFNPVRIFSGGLIISKRKNYFRNILTVLQFTVSIALIFCIMIIEKQINYVKHSDLGFAKEQLLRIDAFGINTPVFINELKQYPNILNVSATSGAPGEIQMKMGMRNINGERKMATVIGADSSFMQTFKVKLLLGRDLLPGEYGKTCLINEAAYKYMGWDNLINKRFENGEGYSVIGVVKDFHYSSFRDEIEPACIVYSSMFTPNIVNIRIKAGALRQTMDYINKIWGKVVPNSNYKMNYQFYDDIFNNMYKKEEKFADTIGIFAVLAVSISCLGILGLVIFASERRSKEIGIRKVHGAKVSELMFMLNKDFLKWVVVASIIALPLGWYAVNEWLENFAYRTEISWWVFALSLIIALLTAFLTVIWQTWRTVRKNPVEVLRYE
ncbi:MAG: ABC transporter permease [Ignavibacteriaceae bacterium]|nr:ABC transporter permease [Ignavibacteriaceae bacterium]